MFSSSSKIVMLSVVAVGLLVSACAVSSGEEEAGNDSDNGRRSTQQQRLDTGSTHAGETIDCEADDNKLCVECGGRSVWCCRTDDCPVINKPPPPPAPTQVRPVPRPLPPIQGTFTSNP